MGETEALAAFATSTAFDDLPESAVTAAKEAIRDYTGVALYGAEHGVGDRIWDYVSVAHGGGDATALVRGETSPTGAALANGTFGHAVDYDDTFESLVIHPTSPIFPAALAGVEAGGDDLPASAGRDALAAYVVGCEVAFRLGQATFPSHYDNGWHATGTIGSFGAAAAAASALGLSTEEATHALGIVASLSSSLKKNFGTMTKPLHAGHAAAAGVRAASLARGGYTADGAVLEGDIGYGEVMTPGGDYDSGAILDELGERGDEPWGVEDVGYKPYPSGVITHAAMDATRDLAREHDVRGEDVEHVVVALDEAANEMLIRDDAQNELEAKFSIEFCLAAVLREAPEEVGVHEFTDEYVTDERTQALMDRVERDFEENIFGGDFAGYGARVRVETKAGETYETELRHAPGSPNNPLDPERLRKKYDECARAVLSPDQADAVAAAIADLDADGALADYLDGVRRAEVTEP